ncbi:hypothetical protein CEXT_237861 [Caerostris extrusa]|uniref:Secreted protein n=1 Tax=Caerostris extrusa TaxID=172846 RepID=A0AAV4XEU8_CAEEX|nr:hypothetical protein CEXT_237861 [Caerostris extrusa]
MSLKSFQPSRYTGACLLFFCCNSFFCTSHTGTQASGILKWNSYNTVIRDTIWEGFLQMEGLKCEGNSMMTVRPEVPQRRTTRFQPETSGSNRLMMEEVPGASQKRYCHTHRRLGEL